MELNNKRYVDPFAYKNFVRKSFLEAATNFAPKITEQLRTEIFPLFLQVKNEGNLDSFIESEFLSTGSENLIESSGGRSEFQKALIAWQKKNFLVENENSDKWVLKQFVNNVLEDWASRPDGINKRALFLKNDEKLPYMPQPPSFYPQDFITLDTTKNLRILEKESAEFIRENLKEYKIQLEKYCKEIETQAIKSSWGANDENFTRDMIWTVESQISGLDYADIAKLGRVRPLNQDVNNRYFSYVSTKDVTLNDLDLRDVEESTVHRAVNKTLGIMGLKPRVKKRGRRFGNRKDDFKKQFVENDEK